MKSVVVTGASTGIGWGCAKVLIGKGFRVFGSVRKQADADRLANAFGANFVPVLFDVTDAAAAKAGAETVAAQLKGEPLFGLVNNAGIAVPGPLLHLDIDEFRHQLEVNVTGQLIVTQAFVPLLMAQPSHKEGPGRIVMISSVGGKNASPFVGAYNASKFAL
jgi:NAD(P)-dependent dehydrogenase (short-subunit alcohol dehydrogenase family)